MAEQVANKGSFLTSAAPLIGAGIDFVSGLGSSLFNLNQARKNRAFQERMYNKQVEDNIRLWHMNNEWNLPINVRKRLEEAGLNPLLMYEGGTSLTSSSVPQGGSAPSGDSARGDFRTNFGQAALQAALVNAQIKNINADTAQKQASAENTQQYTKNLALEWQFQNDTFHIRKLLEYGNYDVVRAKIREIDNNIFNQNRLTTGTLINLQYINENMVNRFHLDKWKFGQDVLGMWENIKIGKQNVAIGFKNAAANWLNAISAANVSRAQVGLLGTQTYQLKKMFPLLKRAQELQNTAQGIANQNQQISLIRNACGIFSDIMNMNKTQAETFRLNFENGVISNTGLGIGNGTLQQLLALPVISLSSMLPEIKR